MADQWEALGSSNEPSSRPSTSAGVGDWEEVSAAPPKVSTPAEKKPDDEQAYLKKVGMAGPAALESIASGAVSMGSAALQGLAGLDTMLMGKGYEPGSEAAKRLMAPLVSAAAPETEDGKFISSKVFGLLPKANDYVSDHAYSGTMKVAPQFAPAAGAGTEALMTLGEILLPGKAAKVFKDRAITPDYAAIKAFKEQMDSSSIKPPTKAEGSIPYEKVVPEGLSLEPIVTIPEVPEDGLDFLGFHADWVSRHLQAEIKIRDENEAWENYKRDNTSRHYEHGKFNQMQLALQKAMEEKNAIPVSKEPPGFRGKPGGKQAGVIGASNEIRVNQNRDGTSSVFYEGRHIMTGDRSKVNTIAKGLQQSTGADLVNVNHAGEEFRHRALGRPGGKQAGVIGTKPATPTHMSSDVLSTIRDKDRRVEPGSTDIESLKEDIRKNGIKKPVTVTVSPEGEAYITDGNNRVTAAHELGIKKIPVKFEKSETPFTESQKAKAKPLKDLGLSKEQIPDRTLTKQQQADREELRSLLGKPLGQIMKGQGGWIQLPKAEEPVTYKEVTTPSGKKLKFGMFQDQKTGAWKLEPPLSQSGEIGLDLPYESNPDTNQTLGFDFEDASKELEARVKNNDPMTIPFASRGKFIPWKQRGAWTPFDKVSPKEKYVNKAVKVLGEDYRKAAEAFWDKAHADFSSPTKLNTHKSIGEQVDDLLHNLFKLDSQRKADRILTKQYLQQLTPREFAVASSERLYHSMPEEEGVDLTPEEQHIKDTIIDPIVKEADDLYKKTLEVGGDVARELDPHNIRTTKESWLNRFWSWADDQTELGATGFGKAAGTQRNRSMFAVEMPDGSRQVINYDGNTIKGYSDKKPYPIARDPGKNIGETLDMGKAGKGKLVQATTAEIEAATNIQYNKNVLANYLSSIAEMRSFIREKEFLQDTMEALKEQGFAVSRQKVKAAPTGFTWLHGESTLDKYYIQDRFAEAFQDTLLRSLAPHSILQRVNSMAVGSMFWNPFPHIFNAFDHYINTVGWDWFNPGEWGTLSKAMTESWRDVSKLTPNYIKYMQSGLGLQYGRVVSQGVYEGMIKGIPETTWKSIAKEWGYGTRPDKMIADIYKGARHVLWGGSDIMMLSAYKFMSSKKGLDIFDTALRNYVEAHNPNYQIPPRIGFDAMMKIPGMPEAVAKAISRNFSLVMQSRLFNVFGRYRYGQMKSIGKDVHDLVKQNTSSVQTRAQALSHLSFVMFNVAVIYPYLWDQMAKHMSGDPNAMQRRSGASTIPFTIWHLVLGDKSVNDLLKEAWNLPPASQLIIEVMQNRNMFTGQHIWEPMDSTAGKLEDFGMYGAGKLVAPLGQLESVLSGRLTPQQALSQSLSIQTQHQSPWKTRMERKERIQALKRDIRRKQRYGL